eukprot:GILJ01010439.1.p1 GENE.GILJ01010439.1~~GILJ01010439.1.p1  ORF type:complete len:1632 (+),score=336.06 GILJ01010439.1:52-4896(+)
MASFGLSNAANDRRARFARDTGDGGTDPSVDPGIANGTATTATRHDLSTARTLVGQCMEKCSQMERILRETQRDLSQFEIEPGTEVPKRPGDYPLCRAEWAVKKYHRSAADKKLDDPADVRPPEVLRLTMDYLMNQIVDLDSDPNNPYVGRPHTFANIHIFVRDRTRSIRQDFILQSGTRTNRHCIEIHERIARFHILSEHQLCEEEIANFSSQQNMEQLNKTLKSLMEFYSDVRSKLSQDPSLSGQDDDVFLSPNEAEFHGYFLLIRALSSESVLNHLTVLPKDLYHSDPVQFALRVFSCLQENNYRRYFKLVTEASYLGACLLHRHFNHVRTQAIKVMMKAYNTRSVAKFPISDLLDLLGFEDRIECEEFCAHFGLQIDPSDDTVLFLPKTSFIEPESKFPVRRADRLIESKVSGTRQQIVDNVVAGGRRRAGSMLPPPPASVMPARIAPRPLQPAAPSSTVLKTMIAQPRQQPQSTVKQPLAPSISSPSFNATVAPVAAIPPVTGFLGPGSGFESALATRSGYTAAASQSAPQITSTIVSSFPFAQAPSFVASNSSGFQTAAYSPKGFAASNRRLSMDYTSPPPPSAIPSHSSPVIKAVPSTVVPGAVFATAAPVPATTASGSVLPYAKPSPSPSSSSSASLFGVSSAAAVGSALSATAPAFIPANLPVTPSFHAPVELPSFTLTPPASALNDRAARKDSDPQHAALFGHGQPVTDRLEQDRKQREAEERQQQELREEREKKEKQEREEREEREEKERQEKVKREAAMREQERLEKLRKQKQEEEERKKAELAKQAEEERQRRIQLQLQKEREERERKLRLRRLKQRVAMLAFRFYLWKKASTESRWNQHLIQVENQKCKTLFSLSARMESGLESTRKLVQRVTHKSGLSLRLPELFSTVEEEPFETTPLVPLDLPQIVGPSLAIKNPSESKLFWKLAVVSNRMSKNRYVRFVSRWLESKLSWGSVESIQTRIKSKPVGSPHMPRVAYESRPESRAESRAESKAQSTHPVGQNGLLSLYKTQINIESAAESGAIHFGHSHGVTSLLPTLVTKDRLLSIGVCVRTVRQKTISQDLRGASSVLFILDLTVESSLRSNQWESERQRLNELVQQLSNPESTSIAIFALSLSSEKDELSIDSISDSLRLDSILQHVHSFKIFQFNIQSEEGIDDWSIFTVFSPDILQQLYQFVIEPIQWLASSTSPQPRLTADSLHDLISDSLDHAVNQLFVSRIPWDDPNIWVQTFTTVLKACSSQLLDESLSDLNWPVPEFASNPNNGLPPADWNSRDSRRVLSSLLDSLELPLFPKTIHSIQASDLNQYLNQLESIIFDYLCSVSRANFKIVSNQVTKVNDEFELALSSIQTKVHDLLWSRTSVRDDEVLLPWPAVMELILMERLRILDNVQPKLVYRLFPHLDELSADLVNRFSNLVAFEVSSHSASAQRRAGSDLNQVDVGSLEQSLTPLKRRLDDDFDRESKKRDRRNDDSMLLSESIQVSDSLLHRLHDEKERVESLNRFLAAAVCDVDIIPEVNSRPNHKRSGRHIKTDLTFASPTKRKKAGSKSDSASNDENVDPRIPQWLDSAADLTSDPVADLFILLQAEKSKSQMLDRFIRDRL